jgi:hypothetical protein
MKDTEVNQALDKIERQLDMLEKEWDLRDPAGECPAGCGVMLGFYFIEDPRMARTCLDREMCPHFLRALEITVEGAFQHLSTESFGWNYVTLDDSHLDDEFKWQVVNTAVRLMKSAAISGSTMGDKFRDEVLRNAHLTDSISGVLAEAIWRVSTAQKPKSLENEMRARKRWMAHRMDLVP